MRRHPHQLTWRIRGRAAHAVVVGAALIVVGVGVPVGLMAAADATTPVLTQHLFNPQPASATVSTEARPVELGVNFVPDVSGQILGVEFLKSAHNVGLHTGSLWTVSGTLLATGIFTKETASGWQRLLFAKPVNVIAGAIYTAGYHAPFGRYDSNPGYFAAPRTSGSLGTHTGAGRKTYSSRSVMPTSSGGNRSNYWVDVIFVPSAAPRSRAAAPSYSAKTASSAVLPKPSKTPAVKVPSRTSAPSTTTTSSPSSSPSPLAPVTPSSTPTPSPSATVSSPAPTPTVTPASPVSSPVSSPTVTGGPGVACLRVPSACGEPDATNTGATGGLVVHAGNLTTTSDGQLIQNLDIQGCLIDVHSGVVIKNVKIEGGCTWSLDAHRATGPLTMTNVTIIATGAQMSAVVVHDDATITGLNAAGGNDVFDTWGGTTTIADSYLHDPTRNAAGISHDDAFQLTGGTATLTHDTLIAPIAAQANSCVQLGDLSGSSNGFTLTNSLCDGGNYSINANGTAITSGNVTCGHLTFTGNRFGTGYRYGVNTNLTAPFSTTWSGNVDDTTGNPV